jgi:hypothetical protein
MPPTTRAAARTATRTAPRTVGATTVVPLRLPVPLAATQGTLALDLEPSREAPPALLPLVGRDLDPRDRSAIEAWAHRFARAAVEIVGGDRPVSQLVRWCSRDVHLDLQRRALLVARAGGHRPGQARVQPARPRVMSVHTTFPQDDVAECAVHVRYGLRSRALAVRFERRATRWVCTALDFA